MAITYSRVWINRVRLPILCSWSAEQGKIIFPCPRACLQIWSREMGSAVPSRVRLLISILWLNLVLTYGIPPEFRGGVHLWNRHTASGQSRVCRVTQLRTDGVHCRESAGTGPVNLKVVPNECCLAWQVNMDQLICASLSHTHYWYEVGMLKVPVLSRRLLLHHWSINLKKWHATYKEVVPITTDSDTTICTTCC